MPGISVEGEKLGYLLVVSLESRTLCIWISDYLLAVRMKKNLSTITVCRPSIGGHVLKIIMTATQDSLGFLFIHVRALNGEGSGN